MAYFAQKAVLAVFAVWGVFVASGANMGSPTPTDPIDIAAQSPWLGRAPTTTTTPVVAVARPAPVTATTVTTIANCGDVERLAVALGWPQTELATFIRVVKAESACYPWAHNLTDPNGGSYGLMQINGFWCIPNQYWPIGWLQAHGLVDSCDDLFNATLNLKAGLAIWRQTGWHAWSTF